MQSPLPGKVSLPSPCSLYGQLFLILLLICHHLGEASSVCLHTARLPRHRTTSMSFVTHSIGLITNLLVLRMPAMATTLHPSLSPPLLPGDFQISLTEEIKCIFHPLILSWLWDLLRPTKCDGRDQVPVLSLHLKNRICFRSLPCNSAITIESCLGEAVGG